MHGSAEKFDLDPERNLIVNYLPQNVSEDDLRNLFSRVAMPTKCRLMKNPATGDSLTYAFVEFGSAEETKEIVSTFNGFKLADKTVKVSYAIKNREKASESTAIKDTNLYVAGLPSWVGDSELQELFSPFGDIKTFKLMTNPDQSSKGVGFVRYNSKAQADYAIEQMNGKSIRESKTPLTVKFAIPPASKQITQGVVQIIGRDANSSSRYNPMAASNQLPLTQVMPIGAPHIPSGALDYLNIGGGHHAHHQQQGILAAAANPSILDQQHPHHQQHQQQQQHISHQQPSSPAQVYVYGLDAEHTELTLYELFSPFGGILNVRLMRDNKKPNQPCKGFGFVNFCKYEEAYKAVLTMNNRLLEKKILQVSFKAIAQQT